MISILCPTRKRPQNVLRLVDSALGTASERDALEFVFYVDEDDQTFPFGLTHGSVKIVMGPRILLSEMWNVCEKSSSGEVLMLCGDDIIFRTPAWDEQILAAFPSDGIGLVYGDDGIQHAGMATHGFLHRNWVDTVGYFVPPYFSSDFNDLWLTEVARAIGRLIYLPDVYTEHMHFCNGKGELDITHQERLVRHQQDNVDALYASLADQRIKDAEKLQDFINQWEKL